MVATALIAGVVAAAAPGAAQGSRVTVPQGEAAAKRYVQLVSADRRIASARVARCHRWYAAVKCWLTIRWKPAPGGTRVTDRELLLVARCEGRLRVWNAARSAAPAGCGAVL